MHCVYKMSVTTQQNDEGKGYIGYGIEVWIGSGTEQDLLLSVPDVFLDRCRAERFIALCNTEEVEPVHLFEVIDNALAE